MKKLFKVIIFILFFLIFIFLLKYKFSKKESPTNTLDNTQTENTITNEVFDVILNEDNAVEIRKEIDDWRITLVNFEHSLPENYELNLTKIDKYREVDSRIVDELNQMLNDMKEDKINNAWVQSAFRSVDYQSEVYNEKINEYIQNGETPENAELLTQKNINKPGTSEHNLGLAIDFNYVNYDFDKTPAYKWLEENAENYGFILRYRKDKENITKVDYEPDRWRYVGVEHAKTINNLDMCLEEYIEYLSLK